MRKMVILLALVAAAFGFTGAMAHDELNEPVRDCSNPVQTDEATYIGVCVQGVGFVYAGSNDNGGGTIAVDGAKEMGGTSGGPESWLDGYLRVDADDDQGLHVYCAGNGAFETGDQADDELVLLNSEGDCGAM